MTTEPGKGTKRKAGLVTLGCPNLPGVWLPYAHSNSVGNLKRAAAGRVLKDVPAPDSDAIKRLMKRARGLGAKLAGYRPWDIFDFPQTLTGAKRTRYWDAAVTASRGVYRRSWAFVNAFIKVERTNPAAKHDPDPRVIQFRKAPFCVMIARFLKPIERKYYHVSVDGVSGLRMIGKGLNLDQRADLTLRKWRRFARPVCVGIDASRFDQHCSKELLKVEHAVYTRATYFERDLLKRLLKEQLSNRVFAEGASWVTSGRRMSGDMNTALGNCILMQLMCEDWLDRLGIDYELFIDGDDTLVFLDLDNLDALLSSASNAFLQYGHEIKIENIARELEQILWCQHRLVNVAGTWTYVADWKKALSVYTVNPKFNEPKQQPRILGAVAAGGLHLNQGVPILQAYYSRLREFGNDSWDLTDLDWLHYFAREDIRHHGLKPVVDLPPVDPTTRDSFHKAFGVDPATQALYEAEIARWSPVLGLATDEPGSIDLERRLDSRLGVASWDGASYYSKEHPQD